MTPGFLCIRMACHRPAIVWASLGCQLLQAAESAGILRAIWFGEGRHAAHEKMRVCLEVDLKCDTRVFMHQDGLPPASNCLGLLAVPAAAGSRICWHFESSLWQCIELWRSLLLSSCHAKPAWPPSLLQAYKMHVVVQC